MMRPHHHAQAAFQTSSAHHPLGVPAVYSVRLALGGIVPAEVADRRQEASAAGAPGVVNVGLPRFDVPCVPRHRVIGRK